jgi:alpha-beta hydrolase superfamily lysophospholipase
MAWCAAHPRDFARLVLASTSAGDLSGPLQRFSPALLPTALRTLAARDPVRREELVLAMTTRMVREPHRLAVQWARYQEDRPVALANILRQLRAARTFRMPKLDVPTFIVAGARDAMVHPSCSYRLAKRLDAPCEIHPEAGHDLPLDDPAWLADRIGAWVNAGPTEIVQQVLPSLAVQLRKERVRIERPAGGSLIATRKRPLGEPQATLVLIHGFAQNRYAFHLPGHSMSGWLAHAGIDTWNVELQGVGRSRAESPSPRTLDELVDDCFLPAVRFIAREVGRPVFVLGHSLGGVITFAGVPAVRDQVAGAIILASAYRFSDLARPLRWLSRGLTAAARAVG